MGIARYLPIHHVSLLLTIMKVVASKSNRSTPGKYEWDEHTEKPNSNIVFYKPGYFKVLKLQGT